MANIQATEITVHQLVSGMDPDTVVFLATTDVDDGHPRSLHGGTFPYQDDPLRQHAHDGSQLSITLHFSLASALIEVIQKCAKRISNTGIGECNPRIIAIPLVELPEILAHQPLQLCTVVQSDVHPHALCMEVGYNHFGLQNKVSAVYIDIDHHAFLYATTSDQCEYLQSVLDIEADEFEHHPTIHMTMDDFKDYQLWQARYFGMVVAMQERM